jgi:hypothetical protein
MRKHVEKVIEWERNEVENGSARWKGLCLKHARTAWNLPVQAPSAVEFFRQVPHSHLFYVNYKDVPMGAIILDPHLSRWGHAWIAGASDHGFSSDYLRSGHIDRVPLHLPRWRNGNVKVHFTDWSHQGLLPINMEHHGGHDRRA